MPQGNLPAQIRGDIKLERHVPRCTLLVAVRIAGVSGRRKRGCCDKRCRRGLIKLEWIDLPLAGAGIAMQCRSESTAETTMTKRQKKGIQHEDNKEKLEGRLIDQGEGGGEERRRRIRVGLSLVSGWKWQNSEVKSGTKSFFLLFD
jgi:hypothetical protein